MKNEVIHNIKEEKDSNYIKYCNSNKLYGSAMSQYLPCGEFEWVSPDPYSSLKILSLLDESSKGFIFEVHLHYPQHHHEIHNDYPSAAEKEKVVLEDLSLFCIKALQNEKLCPATKLTPNLSVKKM